MIWSLELSSFCQAFPSESVDNKSPLAGKELRTDFYHDITSGSEIMPCNKIDKTHEQFIHLT